MNSTNYRTSVSTLNELAPGGDYTLDQCLGHIETLKMRLMGAPGLSEAEKLDFLAELDVLRAGYTQLGGGTTMAPLHAPGHAPRAAGPDPALGEPSIEDVLRPRLGGSSANLKLEGILGQNARIVRNLEQIAKLAPTNLAVLLEGETGSGKELFASIIHANSGLNKLVSVNCGAFPPELVESELFGHVKGAFTGATANRRGKFEEAHGGTIFLDEIGDLEPKAQVKLLRVLDVGEIQRVGSDQIFKVDVRVIAATNCNLEEMVRQGRFREDLYYRLNVCQFYIPPLRDRRDEIALLFEFFVKQSLSGSGRPLPILEPQTERFLFDTYPFPGNIRELKNLSRYIAQIYDGQPLTFADLPERYRRYHEMVTAEAAAATAAGRKSGRHQSVRDTAERTYLASVLEDHRGDIQAVCGHLGLSRSRVYQMLKKHGLRMADFKGR